MYPGNRRFLAIDHSLRFDTTNCPLKGADLTKPPQLKSTRYVQEAYSELSTAKSGAEKKRICQKLVVKVYQF